LSGKAQRPPDKDCQDHNGEGDESELTERCQMRALE
jgi:hypothetical protein